MKYFRKPDGSVSGFDETDETQLSYMQAAIDEGSVDVSDVWPPIHAPTHNEVILAQIVALEATLTPRRIREAVKDPSWMEELETKIAALRVQLVKE